jgi:hypothetical protein
MKEGVMKQGLVVVLGVFLTACARGLSPEPLIVTSAPEIVLITTTPLPPVVVVVTATALPDTSTPAPNATPTPECRKASSVTFEEADQEIAVCGLIIDVGETACSSCPNEKISYLVLKGGMQIISYDWVFLRSFPYEGVCVRVEDKVEMLAGNPVFVFSTAEGYAGAACETGPEGVPVCDSGSYLEFLDQSKCY